MTPKREKYCQLYVKLSNKSEAYRGAYDCKNMKDETVNNNAYMLHKDSDITARIKELQEKLEDKAIYTLEQSIKRDLKLIEMYESNLAVISKMETSEKELEVAQRTIKHIGITAYNSAQDRISRQQGFNEKDNSQKTQPIQILQNNPLSE